MKGIKSPYFAEQRVGETVRSFLTTVGRLTIDSRLRRAVVKQRTHSHLHCSRRHFMFLLYCSNAEGGVNSIVATEQHQRRLSNILCGELLLSGGRMRCPSLIFLAQLDSRSGPKGDDRYFGRVITMQPHSKSKDVIADSMLL